MTVGIGIVGAGRIGQLAHLGNFTRIEGCRVVALADLRPRLGALAAERFGVPRLYSDHRALLDDPEVDAVAVVTRRHATGPIVLEALNAGKHVLSEKPMCHSVEQGERLVAAAARSGTRYAVGFMKRHDLGLQCARRLLDEARASGELGRIVLVRGYCLGGDIGVDPAGFVMTDEPRPAGLELWPMGPRWLAETEHGEYDWFINVNVHLINALRHLLGDELEVSVAELARREGRFAVLRLADAPVLLELGEVESDDWNEGIEIFFEKGSLKIEFPQPLHDGNSARVRLVRGGGVDTRSEVLVPEIAPDWAFRRQAEAFVRDVAEGLTPLGAGADSLNDLRLIEALWRQHLDGIDIAGGPVARTRTG